MKCLHCGSEENEIGLDAVCSKVCMDTMVEMAKDSAAIRGYDNTVVVTGGRDYNGTVTARHWFMSLLIILQASEVVHGAARGADSFCGRVAQAMGLKVTEYPADWSEHGKAAGILRNTAMIQEPKNISALVAFPGGRGTENMLRQARSCVSPRPYRDHWYPIIHLTGAVE